MIEWSDARSNVSARTPVAHGELCIYRPGYPDLGPRLRYFCKEAENPCDIGPISYVGPRDKVFYVRRGDFWSYWKRTTVTGDLFAQVVVPFRGIAGAGVLLPLAWVAAQWRSNTRGHRSGRSLCRACGYDLRATPGRCPECGAVPKAAASTIERAAAQRDV